MRLQELLPSYQLHQAMAKHPWTITALTHVPAAPRLLTPLSSPPVWVASSSRIGSGAVAPSWGSLPARSPSLNLFCSGASSSLLCRPSRSLPASSGLPGGLAMASGGGFRCLGLGRMQAPPAASGLAVEAGLLRSGSGSAPGSSVQLCWLATALSWSSWALQVDRPGLCTHYSRYTVGAH